MREPTEQERKEAGKPVYKVVRVERGKLKSLWVCGTKKCPLVMDGLKIHTITYGRGKLVGNGKYGIWCCKTMQGALYQVDNNGDRELCKIFKAYPLGEQIKPPVDWGNAYGETVLYPAIILGTRTVRVVDRRRGIECR